MNPADIKHLRRVAGANNRYDQQINRLRRQKKAISSIEQAVSNSIKNVVTDNVSSFVIYGEPQSGKTEMMICLTAKLIDSGFDLVIHLLNDSIQLLQQNLERFQRSGLAPAAKNFADVLDPAISLETGQHVIFCKKNANDLTKLTSKIGRIKRRVIIDDEADFATPNAKINRGEVTKINGLVAGLIGSDGIYIGVTATPARLDLNNTFDNDNERWINFPPHSEYTGQDVFFSLNGTQEFRLNLLPDHGDGPKYLRDAVFRFLATVAYVNLSSDDEENFSMLVHTSGMKLDHRADRTPIEEVFQVLGNINSSKFQKYADDIKNVAQKCLGPIILSEY